MVMIWCTSPGVFVEGDVEEFREKYMDLPLYRGVSLMGVFPNNPRIICLRKPFDYFALGSFFVVSSKTKEIMQAARANAEYFKVVITFKQKTLDNFFFVNLLDVLDCIDTEKSEIVPVGAFSHSIKRLALKLAVVKDTPVFRVADTVHVGASDELASEIQKARCTGVCFKKPEDWRNPALNWT